MDWMIGREAVGSYLNSIRPYERPACALAVDSPNNASPEIFAAPPALAASHRAQLLPPSHAVEECPAARAADVFMSRETRLR